MTLRSFVLLMAYHNLHDNEVLCCPLRFIRRPIVCLFISHYYFVGFILLIISLFIFLTLVWSRRQRRVRARAIRANGTGRDSTPSWTRWPVSCLTRLRSSPNWTGSPFWGCPSATCAPRAIFKVYLHPIGLHFSLIFSHGSAPRGLFK